MFSLKSLKKQILTNKIVCGALAILMIAGIAGVKISQKPVYAHDENLNIWWPADNAKLSGIQPFKAELKGYSLNQYNMYWKVDNDRLNQMFDSYDGYPHKQIMVNLSNWNWHSNGIYPITFVAKDMNGKILAQNTVSVNLNLSASANQLTSGTETLNPTPVNVSPNLDVSWPQDGITVSGMEPLKASLDNMSGQSYTMYWQVDNDQLNYMSDNGQYGKQALVDFDGWSWHGNGPYKLNFVAKDSSGTIIAQKAINVYTNAGGPTIINNNNNANLSTTNNNNSGSNASITNSSSSTSQSTGTGQNQSLNTGYFGPQVPNNQISSQPLSTSAINLQKTNISNDVVSNAYNDWKTRYVSANGAGGALRVVRPENGNDTVSEGQGYGMLAAVFANDQATFNALWNYSKSHLNDNGVMAWHIDSNNNAMDMGAATDADEDMAYALLVAEKKWGGYQNDAKGLISNIFNHEVEHPTNVLKPGDRWGGSDSIDVSYLSPAYYKSFAAYTGNQGWNDVANVSYDIISRSTSGTTGLVPNWTNISGGEAASNMGPDKNNFTYDAIRTPLRLAMDAKWNGDSRAKMHLDRMSSFFSTLGAENLKSGYTLSGSPLASYLDDTFVSCIAAGASQSSDAQFAQTMQSKILSTPGNSYFGTSLRLISLMFITGVMTQY